MITRAGIYDLTAEEYHADPVLGGSLSSSSARELLPPSCPAKFRYNRQHPTPPSRAFDLGHAAHRLVLGRGADLVIVDFPDYRTKAAQTLQREAHATGRVPVLAHEMQAVKAMAAAVQEHPYAAALFAPDSGQPEQTLVWRDPATGVWCRAMLDWLPDPLGGRRLVVPDYKTCVSAATEDLARAVASHGYHQQAAWYLDGIAALDIATDAAFVFVAQEKTPPYLVNVIELDAVALGIGSDRNTRARQIYAECTATGVWGGYAADVALVALPRWAEYQHEELFDVNH